ncbi:MAG: serine/threonine protein kinase, partial [Planctomycetes bacterium]|nr:serine/threonine protein kinase [Planctomycetota bacterium]
MPPEEHQNPDTNSSRDDGKFDSNGQPVFAPIEALIGTDLGHYRIVEEICRGSMGVVFEGYHRLTDQRVAIKVLPPHISGKDKVIRRFLREAESVAKLNHPHIVKIYDIGHKDSLYYYAMERVIGEPLDNLLKEAKHLSFKRIARLMVQACDAIHFAHQQHIIHRDIKPGNLIVAEGDKVIITDFGLARQEKAATLTESGALVGTPIYMSPEQVVAKRGGVDKRTDIYSLGVTLYQLLAGRPPFRAESTQKILNQILDEDPAPPRRTTMRIPRALRVICMKAIEKNPDARFQSAAEMAEEFRRYLSGASIKSRPASLFNRAVRRIKRHKVISFLATLSIILALTFTVHAIRASRKIKDTRKEQDSIVLAATEQIKKYYENVQAAKDLIANAGNPGVNLNVAYRLLNEAAALFPKRPEAHLYLGKIHSLQGDPRKSLYELQAACEL